MPAGKHAKRVPPGHSLLPLIVVFVALSVTVDVIGLADLLNNAKKQLSAVRSCESTLVIESDFVQTLVAWDCHRSGQVMIGTNCRLKRTQVASHGISGLFLARSTVAPVVNADHNPFEIMLMHASGTRSGNVRISNSNRSKIAFRSSVKPV